MSDDQQTEPQSDEISYQGPFQIRQHVNGHTMERTITVSRLIRGKKVSWRAVSPESKERDTIPMAVNECIRRITYAVFKESGTNLPYIQMHESDTKWILNLLQHWDLPVHVLPDGFGGYELVDQKRVVILWLRGLNADDARAISRIINILPVLLLARE